jgi:hypothetical protein
MDIREVIRKAKLSAKTPDEALLPELFEEYLDLIEMRVHASEKELAELAPRLRRTFLSLKEIADRVSVSYGMDPAQMVEFFINAQNQIGAEWKGAIQKFKAEPKKDELPVPVRKKRKNKSMKV